VKPGQFTVLPQLTIVSSSRPSNPRVAALHI
jgi:hypothetical protein